VTGTGFHVTSVTGKVGAGLGVGFSFNPWGKQPDACAPRGSNSAGGFIEGSISALFLELGAGYNAGMTTWQDANDTVHYHPYSGPEGEFSGAHGEGGLNLGLGLEVEGSAGFAWTKYF
jgi:hypothetical protein